MTLDLLEREQVELDYRKLVRARCRASLAAYAHDAWGGWMVYLFSKCTTNPDGSVTIPRASVDRWKRQMQTPYGHLSVGEQESDLAEADKMLNIVG